MIELHENSSAPAATPARRARLGFAGVGWIGRNRLQALLRSGFVEAVAIAEPDAACAAAARELCPDAVFDPRFETLLDLALDGIVIATPSALHALQAVSAFRAEKAVFCQKPLARTAAETGAVIAAARCANRLLGVDLSYRCTAGMRAIHHLISSGELGEIYAVEAVFHNAYGPDNKWFYNPQLSGGGCLLDLGIHLIDLALWALDFPAIESAASVLLAQGRPLGPAGDDVEDYAAATLQLATGASLQLACSWRAPAGCGARIEATFFGSRGGAVFRNVNGSFYEFVAEHLLPDRSRRVLAQPPDDWNGRAAVGWAEQLLGSPDFDPAAERLVNVAETLDELYGRA